MNAEQQAEKDPEVNEKALVATADPALTLAAKKLAGSACCLNCGTGLQGPFCYYCGQPDRNFMRFFPALIRDLMEDLLDLDSRFMRTVKPLLFKPGRLTRDYMEGRRFRYAPPMRLYIFSSIVFFLLATLLSSDAITLNGEDNKDGIIQISSDGAETHQEGEEALSNLPPEIREKIDMDHTHAETEQEDEDDPGFKLDDIQFNDEPWNRETNHVDIKWFPGCLNDSINDDIEGSLKKAEQINENP